MLCDDVLGQRRRSFRSLRLPKSEKDRIAEEVIEEWISFQMALSNTRNLMESRLWGSPRFLVL